MRRAGLLGVIAALAAIGTVPAHAGVISQGAFRLGADVLWSQGLAGPGETIAIVDDGFGGLDAAIAAGELPPRERLTTRSFDVRYGLEGRNRLGLPTEHGTRMAEIVHDVAPGAQLVLVNYGTVAEFVQAADWVASQGIPVVSHSNSFLDGPFDGTGPAAAAVDRAAAAGVLWVNSAGNFGQRHWAGRAAPEGTVVPLPATPGSWIDLHLSWRDPGASASLVLERQGPDGTWAPVVTGTPSGPVSVATEHIRVEDGAWRAVLRQTAGVPQDLTLISGSLPLGDLAVGSGSVLTPGDARGALSVGAVPWRGRVAAPYSSQGPTDDGRLKPEVVGPTYVTANPAFPGTAGTSAATAHVAGAAVLLRARRTAQGLPAGAAELRSALIAGASDLGPPGPDALYGAGMVRLDTSPPRLTVRFLPGRSLLRVRAVDDGTLEAIEVLVPGSAPRVVRRSVVNLRLRLRAPGARVTVTARDMSGNAVVRSIWAGRTG